MRNGSRVASALILAVALALGSTVTAGAAEGNSPWETIKAELAALSARVETLEAQAPAPQDDFWPVDELETDVIVQATEYSWGSWYINVSIEASVAPDPAYIDTTGYGAYQSIIMLQHDGQTYRGEGVVSLDSMDIATKPEPGSPLVVEYWVEKYGVREHETITITDWTYQTWYYPPYPY